MRLDIFLRATSSEQAIKFYVEELGMFELATDYGMNDFLLLPITNPCFGLHISERLERPSSVPLFGLSVDNCDAEFRRLQDNGLRSGARIVPGPDSVLAVFDWPGGRNFMVEDPSGNRIVLFEDFIAPDPD